MHIKRMFFLFFVFSIGGALQAQAIVSGMDIAHPVTAKNGMVATQQHYATQAGLDVLREGGNAIDAAVTVGFTLAVTLPRAGNIGGGGFMLVHLAKTGSTLAIDYREKAPKKSFRDMYLGADGNADPEKSRYSMLSAGVPGTVAGMAFALEKYGTISLKRALQPAIKLANEGFVVDEDLLASLAYSKKRMQRWPETMKIFFKNGQPYKTGELLKQKDLAKSLQKIADQGPDAFYKGDIADALAAAMKKHGGLISKEDLAAYKPAVRTPIRGEYRGYEIHSMPPPSSGGIHLVQILNLLEPHPIGYLGHNSAQTIHLMAESMKLAYADRSKHLGDSDFVKVPVKALVSKKYANVLRKKINKNTATPSRQISPGDPWPFQESAETTHYSVMDKFGNAVSNTYTLNFSYGNKFTIPGTGILLNNEMDDFSAKPGSANAYGLIGGEYNAVEPEKRMLSSMSPTIVMKDSKPFLVTGSPGGSRIITTTLQVIMNVIDHKMNIAAASNAVRFHHQWFPDEIRTERGLNSDTVRLLNERGHNVVEKWAMGSTQSIMRNGDYFYGASDLRRQGALTLGF